MSLSAIKALKHLQFSKYCTFPQTDTTSCRYCRVLTKCIVIFRKRFIQSEFFDVFYCGHVTYQIWAWFETFKENVNRTNMVNFQCPLDFRSQKKEVLRFP